MDVNVAHLDTGKLHPLYVHYDGQIQPQPAYVEFDTRTGDLSADWNGEIGNAVPMDVWKDIRLRWSIAYEHTEAEINALLDEIASGIKWDESEKQWLYPDVEQLAYNAKYNTSAAYTDRKGIWDAKDYLEDNEEWHDAKVTIWIEEWSITATTSDTDLEKIAKSMQDDANGDGVTLSDIDLYLKCLRDEAIKRSEKD